MVTAASDALRDVLRTSEEALLRCEERNSEDRAVHAVTVSVLEQQLLLVRVDCDEKEVEVSLLQSSLEAHEKAESAIKSQLSHLAMQLDEALRLEQQHREARLAAEQLLGLQTKRRPWFLFFWPF